MLQAAKTGYKDVVCMVNEIVRVMPSGVQLKLRKMPFFEFRDPRAEQGFAEMMILRKTGSCHWKTNAGLGLFLLIASIYCAATCDIDKNLHMREWIGGTVVCGTSFVLLAVTTWGMRWSIGEMNEGLQMSILLQDGKLYSMTRKAKILCMVSDGRLSPC